MIKKYSLKYNVDKDPETLSQGIVNRKSSKTIKRSSDVNDFMRQSGSIHSFKPIAKSQGLELEYNEYLKSYQPMFVLSC